MPNEEPRRTPRIDISPLNFEADRWVILIVAGALALSFVLYMAFKDHTMVL